ncbi:MAG: hypothetical protein IPI67_00155 [Myxococcales bacterium]|nr:hypothetical protein [Myxococcales bacterium]
MRALTLLMLFVASACNDPRTATPTADAGPDCDTPASCCQAGDAGACETAAERAPVAERRALLERGCELASATACLRGAVLHLGGDVVQARRMATRGCGLDSRAWVPGADGESLSCAFFDGELMDRAEQLGGRCAKRESGSCRALGDLLRPYDSAQAKEAWASECRAGGIDAAESDECLHFLEFLATPPRCPASPRTTSPSYGRCPSEAKGPPKHMGRVHITSATDEALRTLFVKSEPMKYCYAAGLVDSPKLSGTVRLSVRVDARGRPYSVSSEKSALADPMALECLVRETAELHLTPLPGAQQTAVIELRLEP